MCVDITSLLVGTGQEVPEGEQELRTGGSGMVALGGASHLQKVIGVLVGRTLITA